MTEAVKKTNAKSDTDERKVAPQVSVNSRRGSMDDLYAEKNGKEYAYASGTASEESLSSQGLQPVKGKDGKVLMNRSRVICEDVGTVRSAEIKSQFDAATERMNEIRDPQQQNSADKHASPKSPSS